MPNPQPPHIGQELKTLELERRIQYLEIRVSDCLREMAALKQIVRSLRATTIQPRLFSDAAEGSPETDR